MAIIFGIVGFFIGLNQKPKSGLKIFGSLLVLSGGVMAGCLEEGIATMGTLIFIIGTVLFFYSVFKNKNSNKIANNVSNDVKEKNEYNNELAVKIYSKCLVKGIMDIDSAKNIDALDVIAYSYGVDDIALAKEYFYLGEKKFKDRENEKKSKWNDDRLKDIRDRELKIYNEAKRSADIVGKDKYTYSLKKDLEYGYKALELSEKAEKIGLTDMNAKARKSDWAIWGGMANGIAGPAAGIATAIDIQRKNIEAEKNILHVRESGKNLYKEAKKVQRDLPKALENEELMKKYFEDRLIDDRNPDEKMNNLMITNIEYFITAGRNFNIKAKYKCNKDITLVDSEAILDGSLKIEVYDIEDSMVASGYYVAPGIEKFDLNYTGNDGFDLNSSGFEKNGEINCICISNNYRDVDEDIEYKVIIKPFHLWIIEK